VEDSTRLVLDLVYTLQFVGRKPLDSFLASRLITFFDPVPMAVIHAELAGVGRIDPDRECRLLAAMGMLRRLLHTVAPRADYVRPDGKRVRIVLERAHGDPSRADPGEEYLRAYVGDACVYDHAAEIAPRLEERPPPWKRGRFVIECFSLLPPGVNVARHHPTGTEPKPQLDATSTAILESLEKTHVLMKQAAIAAAVGFDEKTVRDRLRLMEKAGIVHRPKGERSGWTVCRRFPVNSRLIPDWRFAVAICS
jgi:hypothetical protein